MISPAGAQRQGNASIAPGKDSQVYMMTLVWDSDKGRPESPVAEGGPTCLEGESAPPSPFQRSLRSLPPLLGRGCVLGPGRDIPLDLLP
jgi:hypothetical protein